MDKKHDKFLFAEMDKARYGEGRPRRLLFLPKFLKDAASDERLRHLADRAHQVFLKWADLETSGKLRTKNETALEGEFLNEVFGQALGYKLFSANETQWNLEAKYSVNGGQADAAIGLFEHGRQVPPVAVIELKGPTINVDRDRFNGRTAVQQCWDYLNAIPRCPWAIVSNYVSFRLYHRDQTPAVYQSFTLQELRIFENFQRFYYIFQRSGLLPETPGQSPRADRLLDKTNARQREVGDELYQDYHRNRIELIHHLTAEPLAKPLDKAIRIAQKLIDRIIFIAFCEDRGLLPERSIYKACEQLSAFHLVTNPRWQNFLALFRSIDKGDRRFDINPFNGGLFKDDEVDHLDLDDDWTDFFKNVGSYDFQYEVNVDILGHLFERSVNDIERIRTAGFFESGPAGNGKPKMPKSAERKRFGVYYTPPDFTRFITFNTIGKLIQRRFEAIAEMHKLSIDELGEEKPNPKRAALWRECLDAIRQIKIMDPACGSGAFLIQAYELLEYYYLVAVDHIRYHEKTDKSDSLRDSIPDWILQDNLHGVDLSPEAVEITQLALWIRSAHKGKSLADLSRNIVCGNSLIEDSAAHPKALDWKKTFPGVFTRENPGFDCVIGNPPWERMKLQEREFFDDARPDIAAAVSAAARRKLIAALEKSDPKLYRRYQDAQRDAENALDFIRSCGRFPLTAVGDVNTYAVFAELAHNLVAPDGRVGILVPSGISTDHTTRNFFQKLTDSQALIGLYDFENKAPVFPDVHRSFKFCVLLFGGSKTQNESIDFVFFARQMKDLEESDRHITLTPKDFKLLNPNTRTCPIFRSSRDAEITKAVYRRVPVLIDRHRKSGGNPWGVKFLRMLDQTNDAELFLSEPDLKKLKARRDGLVWKKGKQTFLPLYEAKMVQMYDHRAASVVVKDANWMRQGQTDAASDVQHQNPEFSPEPRWWVLESKVLGSLKKDFKNGFIGFKDITSPTNERTMIASAIPWSAVTNHFPLVLTEVSQKLNMCLLANFNSFIFDFIARQKIGGITLNFFIVEQLPVFHPDFYSDKCPWSKKQTLEKWISDRVLKLTCASEDMIPLAKAAGLVPPVHPWKLSERFDLMAQLDAAFFLLYGVDRDDVGYILSTFSAADAPAFFAPGSPNDRILKYYDEFKSEK
jgi:hypothetical protein